MTETTDRQDEKRPQMPVPGPDQEGVTPGMQERPMTEEEGLDESLEETFPASDPIAPSRIDGPTIDPGKHM